MKKECFKIISKAFQTSHSSYATICIWLRYFKRKKSDFKDGKRSGAPSTVSSNEKAEKIKVL